jgi:hypothetical protein
MNNSTSPTITFKIPTGYFSYILTFKKGDIHPVDHIEMTGRGVRIFAPGPQEAIGAVRHRYGRAFNELHEERRMRIVRFPGGIYETLLWKKENQ